MIVVKQAKVKVLPSLMKAKDTRRKPMPGLVAINHTGRGRGWGGRAKRSTACSAAAENWSSIPSTPVQQLTAN